MKDNLRTAWNSRQYMLKKDFEIYYYSDSRFHTGTDHTHAYYEFYLFLEGSVSMMIAGKEYPLMKGDLIIIPPDVHHHIIIHDENRTYSRFVFWITKEYCLQLMRISPDYAWLMQNTAVSHQWIHHMDNAAFNTIQSRMIALLQETHSERFGQNAYIQLLVNELVLQLNRSVYETENSQTQEDNDFFSSLILYMDTHFDENLTLSDLASHFYVSPYYIAHCFKENMGISVHQYMLKKRLEACAAMIAANRTVGDAWEKTGFHDYSAFYRAFKKEFSLSPREYLQLIRQTQTKSHVV